VAGRAVEELKKSIEPMADDQRFDRMEKHLDKLGEKIDDLTKVVTTMARIEERMVTLFKRMDRYEAEREQIELRLGAVESSNTQNSTMRHAIDKGFWLVVGAALAIAVKVATANTGAGQ
jgi:SMC interacting uncharacterized protein involved in chromosome segregation